MAAVVFVHGIGQRQRGPATVGEPWRLALADGVWKAGHPDLADRLRAPVGSADRFEASMAFYADLFDPPGRQGGSAGLEGLDPVEAALVEELASCWLRRAVDAAGSEEDRAVAGAEVARLDGSGGQVQGAGNAARGALAGLAQVRWFAPFGMAVARRFVVRALTEVVRYLSEPALREQVQARVAALVDEDTRVVIGHSLGSVVAFEAACRVAGRLPLLVTLGSPLGLRRIVYDRLDPQPPRFPAAVDRWVNIAAEDDIVAAVPDLTRLFPAPDPAGVGQVENVTVDNGSAPHEATHYLTKKQTGEPVAQALTGGA